MRNLILLTSLLILSFATKAQTIQSDAELDFTQIALSGKVNVTLEESDRNYFEIDLIDADANRLNWSCTDGKLTVRLRSNTQRENSSADVRIYYKSLSSLNIANGSVRTLNPVTGGILTVNAASGATANIETTAKDVTIIADGNSATTLSGNTLYLTIRANSKAKVDARALEARSAIVSTQFGAEVFVWGTEKLDANAGSNSVIYYKGTPELFKRNETMYGTVEQFAY